MILKKKIRLGTANISFYVIMVDLLQSEIKVKIQIACIQLILNSSLALFQTRVTCGI